MAVRRLRLSELQSVLQTDSSGKIVKNITNPVTGTATTSITTIVTGSSSLTLAGDTGTVTFNLAETNLSAIGGSNINTRVQNGNLVIGLNSQINLAQVNVVATGSANTFTSRDTNNNIQFGITSTGVPYMESRTTLPPLISGLVYISGSNALPEGFYLGFTGDPGITEAERGDLTP